MFPELEIGLLCPVTRHARLPFTWQHWANRLIASMSASRSPLPCQRLLVRRKGHTYDGALPVQKECVSVPCSPAVANRSKSVDEARTTPCVCEGSLSSPAKLEMVLLQKGNEFDCEEAKMIHKTVRW